MAAPTILGVILLFCSICVIADTENGKLPGRKVSIKYSIVYFSYRAWKYESNGARVEVVSAILAGKNES